MSKPSVAAPVRTARQTLRWVAVALIAGTLLYIVPSALHGNPPVDSARETLEYVHERPSWRPVHLVNILAVLIWAAAFAALAPVLAPAANGLRRVLTSVFPAAAAVFAVYFSIHAFALPAAADDYFEPGAVQSAVLERAETALYLLGATAFTAQAMLGLSVALCGTLVLRAAGTPAWLGWTGVVVGAGWLLGALVVSFAVIVPFTVLTWLWMIALAVTLWRRGDHPAPVRPRAATGAATGRTAG